jgi:hypothetical protein
MATFVLVSILWELSRLRSNFKACNPLLVLEVNQSSRFEARLWLKKQVEKKKLLMKSLFVELVLVAGH